MEEIGLRDFLYIAGILLTALTTFLTTKHNLKEKIQQTREDLKDLINKSESNLKERNKNLEIEIERLRGKDENQQQVIDEFRKQILDHLPDLFEILKDKKGKK